MATKKSGRPVDEAMDQERPEKRVVREIWADVVGVESESPHVDALPLFLTLSGEEARDIELLVDRGILKKNEVGGLSEDSLGKVIAVESRPQAVLALQKKYPGLRIVEQPFQNLVRGARPTRYPERDHEAFCKALVVNLDLNTILRDTAGEFEIFSWIVKLANIHADQPAVDWSLCLTLHGEIGWSDEANRDVKNFLAENFERSPEFRGHSAALLGEPLIDGISGAADMPFGGLAREEQQKILMLFVPKKILSLVHTAGWRIATDHNLRYGAEGHAPMVTWVMRFTWDEAARNTPNANYLGCLAGILENAGAIAPSGEVTRT